MSTVNGKRPISSKQPAPKAIDAEDLFGNFLSIDPELKKEIESKDLEYRFISAPQLQNAGGYHSRGWRPYKRQSMIQSTQEHTIGKDPEGYVRRGELVLAVRTKELSEKHRAYLAQEAKRAQQSSSSKVAELRESLKGKISVTEGYDDTEEGFN